MASYKKAYWEMVEEKEKQRMEKEKLQKEVEKLKIEKSKRWSAKVYCSHCQTVNSCSMPTEVNIKQLDCVNCRVRGYLFLIRE